MGSYTSMLLSEHSIVFKSYNLWYLLSIIVYWGKSKIKNLTNSDEIKEIGRLISRLYKEMSMIYIFHLDFMNYDFNMRKKTYCIAKLVFFLIFDFTLSVIFNIWICKYNMYSNRSIESEISLAFRKLWQTDQPTGRPTDRVS